MWFYSVIEHFLTVFLLLAEVLKKQMHLKFVLGGRQQRGEEAC